MGTSYYMVKDDEKIYVGRNLMCGEHIDIKEKLDMITDKYLYMEVPMDFLYKKINDLNIADYGKIGTYLDDMFEMIRLLEHTYLMTFYIDHYDDYKEWSLKSDYELSEE